MLNPLLTVLLVKKKELNKPQNALVLMVCLKLINPVNHVTINVTNVSTLLIIVTDVLLTDLINQPVTVLLDTTLSQMNQNVHLVDIDVDFVKILNTIVSNVLKEDSDYQIVVVQLILSMMVPQNVNLVVTDVLNVKELKITVPFVPLTEWTQPIVSVHLNMVTMKLLVKLTAHLVTSDVKPVLPIPLVKFVPSILTELLNQFVTVLLDTLKTIPKSVHHVTLNVLNVLIMPKTVPSVETQESTHQFVTVQMVYSLTSTPTQKMLNVILVLNNVTPVSITPKIV